MPNITVIRSAVAELPEGPPLVAALAGGTTGIGSYVANALARAFAGHGSKLRVYIVGRNAERAEAVMTEGRRLSPGSDWRFVQATDLALISEVDRACADIMRQETEAPLGGGPVRLDLLYMSHCYPILKERSTTKEGLDAFLSTVYYSRIRFVTQLLPLLTASSRQGHVVSIYAGTFEDGTGAGDAPIGCPPPESYGVTGVRKHASFMKTFVFEELAERHAGKLSLSHIYPGLVDGPGFASEELPAWSRILWRMFKPVLRPLAMTPPDDCGDVMLYLATARYPAKGSGDEAKVVGGAGVARSTKGDVGGGCYSAGQRGDVAAKGVSYEKARQPDTGKKCWDHTMETLDRIEKENARES